MASMNVQQYRSMLHINKHRLDEELEVQSEIQERISTHVSRLNSKMLDAQDQLKRVEARLLFDYKEREEKLTAEQVKARIHRDSDRTRAWEAFQEAREAHEEWDGVLTAWKQRSFNIRALTDLYAGQYFALRSVTASRERRPTEGRGERAARVALDSIEQTGGEVQRARRHREE